MVDMQHIILAEIESHIACRYNRVCHMNDYKMEVYRGDRVIRKGTRCYDIEKILQLGREQFKSDKTVTKIIMIQIKYNNRVTLRRNLLRTMYRGIKISTM